MHKYSAPVAEESRPVSYVDPQLLSHPGVQEVQAQARAPSDDLRRHSQKSSERPFFIRVRDGFPCPPNRFLQPAPELRSRYGAYGAIRFNLETWRCVVLIIVGYCRRGRATFGTWNVNVSPPSAYHRCLSPASRLHEQRNNTKTKRSYMPRTTVQTNLTM